MGHKNIHIYSQSFFREFYLSILSVLFKTVTFSAFGTSHSLACTFYEFVKVCNKWEYPCAFNEIPTFISSTWNNHYLFVGMGVEWGAGATPLSAEFWFVFLAHLRHWLKMSYCHQPMLSVMPCLVMCRKQFALNLFSETTRPRALIYETLSSGWTSTNFIQLVTLGSKVALPRGSWVQKRNMLKIFSRTARLRCLKFVM